MLKSSQRVKDFAHIVDQKLHLPKQAKTEQKRQDVFPFYQRNLHLEGFACIVSAYQVLVYTGLMPDLEVTHGHPREAIRGTPVLPGQQPL